ncbi:MAG: phage portal protein [Lactobacillus iners]|nr:phage portal protein [Lactobacillus iners]
MTFFRSLTSINDISDFSCFPASQEYTSVDKLQNSNVFTAVNVIANDIATNPIKLESDNVNHIADENFSDLNYLLNVKPNSYMSARDFKYALTANLLLTGNGYARILKTKSGQPLSLVLLYPSWVTVEIDEDSNIRYVIQDNTHNPYILTPDEIIHVKFLSTNGLIGTSPLYSLADEMKLQKQGNKLLNDFFGSGINGSAILKMPGKPSPDARAKIREEWIKANTGEKTHRVMVLAGNEEYTPVEIDTSILKIVNSNDYTTKQIAKAFGIPVSRLGLENAHTSLTQSNLDYIQNSLDHYFNRITSELNIKLLTYEQALNYHFEFDVSRLMELDTETNMKETLNWFQNGLIDDNEARQRLGYAPHNDDMAGTRIVMSNFIPIENIKDNYPNNVVQEKTDETNGEK